MAANTKELQLMTGVITPLFRYNPAVVAQAAATVDRLSGGRFMLGVGTGEPLNEVPLGYKFPKYKERAERISEALQIIRALFDGEKLTYDGNYYHTENAKLYSPPKGRIPIYLAAACPKSARLAGEYADGIIISVKQPEDAQANVLEPARKEANKKGRNLKVLATRWTIFAKSDKEAWEALKSWRGLRTPHRNTISNPEELQREADTLPRDEVLSKYTIVSSMDGYVDAYRPLLTELNADVVVFQTTSTDQKK
jgi:coenzyme F420-dependent glucose-6-phosphate dehydrogenase